MFTPLVVPPAEAKSSPGRWFILDERQNVLMLDGQLPSADSPPATTTSEHFLGMDDDVAVWTGQFDPTSELPEDAGFVSLRDLFGLVPEDQWALAGRAAQVLTWDRDHQFCGRCGTATEAHHRDRAKRCPSCGLHSYPRLSPAVIMLVERGDEVLLAWGRQFPSRFFSTLAGFVEPGETLEECVVREVFEETSINVADVRYFASQPWPFPHSVMIGFIATYESGELEIDEHEIVEAGWFSVNELPHTPPRGMSIAGDLIHDWIQRVNS